jgi:hypothetical protein
VNQQAHLADLRRVIAPDTSRQLLVDRMRAPRPPTAQMEAVMSVPTGPQIGVS